MEIRELLRTLARHRILALAVFFAVVAVGAAAAFLRTNEYHATATVTAVPPAGASFDQVTAVQFLLPSVVDQVSTVSFKQIVESSSPGVSLHGVSIEASLEQGTGILHVTATSTRRHAVVPVANAAAAALVRAPITQGLTLRVLDPAHKAVSSAAQLRAPILISSIVLGVILAFFFALIRASLDRRLRSNEERYAQLGLEVLGEIPAVRRFPSSPADLFAKPKAARVAEAYQRLVANLEVIFAGRDVRTIAITSSASNEGKTTVTASLAWALALLGHRVVVIDGDLRKPTLHERLHVDPAGGLANSLDGDGLPVDRPTELDSLTVIPAGRTAVHPARVVNQALPRVLARFSDRLVLIDTPPAPAAAEATLLAMMAKNVILVVDPRKRSVEELEHVVHDLRRADATVLGVVVNRTKVARRSGYDDYYLPVRASVEGLPSDTRRKRNGRSAASRRRTVS